MSDVYDELVNDKGDLIYKVDKVHEVEKITRSYQKGSIPRNSIDENGVVGNNNIKFLTKLNKILF
jgi:hypothetical protein